MTRQDQPGVERLIEEHSGRAYAAAYRLTGNEADAWDLVQEAFVRALEKSAQYDPSFDFGGWLHRLLYRVYLNRRRGQSRRREQALEPEAAPAAREPAAESPEAAAQRRETRERIDAGLARLPDDQRACLLLVDVEGRGYEEAADILGWPVGSVAGRLFRARRQLRAWLDEPTEEKP